MNWEWDEIVFALFALVVCCALFLGGFAVCQDHTIRFYYIAEPIKGYCINGYREWTSNDAGVFCSDDIQKTIGVLKQMNDGLVLGRKAGSK